MSLSSTAHTSYRVSCHTVSQGYCQMDSSCTKRHLLSSHNTAPRLPHPLPVALATVLRSQPALLNPAHYGPTAASHWRPASPDTRRVKSSNVTCPREFLWLLLKEFLLSENEFFLHLWRIVTGHFPRGQRESKGWQMVLGSTPPLLGHKLAITVACC